MPKRCIDCIHLERHLDKEGRVWGYLCFEGGTSEITNPYRNLSTEPEWDCSAYKQVQEVL